MRKYSIKNKDELELLDVIFIIIKDWPAKGRLYQQLQEKFVKICILWSCTKPKWY